MRWRDEHPTEDPGAWAGLELIVSRGGGARRRPGLEVQCADGRRIRVCRGEAPILWARVAPGWTGVSWLRATDAPPAVIPPLSVRAARAVGAASRSPAWYAAWARRLATHLRTSPRSPLYPGRWSLSPYFWPDRGEASPAGVAATPLHGGRAVGAQPPCGWESWGLNGSGGVLALRSASPPDSGRVKALSKLAHDGTLPPILLFFVSGLDMFLLLDGHDRLQAAELAGRPIPALALSPAREVTFLVDEARRRGTVRDVERALERQPRPKRLTVGRLNRALIAAFREPRFTVSRVRAWPIPGGAERWTDEVHRRLAVLGEPDAAFFGGGAV